MEKTIRQGRNVKRFREMPGIKQDVLANDPGLSQQAIAALEQKEALEEAQLQQIAALLKVPAEAIKNFDEENALNIISNTFHEAAFINSTGTFNIDPVEKWMEALGENKNLYERLLNSEKEKVALLQQLLNEKR